MEDGEEFKLGPEWEAKTNFAPGVPDDGSNLPTLRYQALLGRVYTLMTWPDWSTVRGEVPLSDLEALAGGNVAEGWYDATGTRVAASSFMDLL